MAQMRITAVVAAVAIAMGTLAGTGCSSRDTGSNVKNGTAPDTVDMVADGAVVRPLGFWAGAIGAIGWVIALPFTLPSGSAGDTAKAWVGDPWKYTFCRPIGQMEDNADQPCFGDDG